MERQSKVVIAEALKKFTNQDVRDYQLRIMQEYAAIGDHTLYGGKNCGSDAEHQGSKYIAEELKKLGVDAVELIPVKTDRFQFNDATIKIVGISGETREIKPYANNAPGTSTEGITGEVVDLVLGDRETFDHVDVQGKILILEINDPEAFGLMSCQLIEANRRGALAVILYTSIDILTEDDIRAYPLFGANIPVLSVSINDAMYLKNLAKTNKEMKVHIWADIDYVLDGGITYEVVGEFKGQTDERILFTSHLDHYFRCLQDNISSVATLLGIAKCMIDSGYKPIRTITFAFNGSHELGNAGSFPLDLRGMHSLLEQKKEWEGKILADINFEYTAFELINLAVISAYELATPYLDYIRYMPERVNGFKAVAKDVDTELYWLATWTDCAPIMARGIPFIMNESITEQIFSSTSAYIGRDHSTADNWDIFSGDALLTNTHWFGGFAIYMDQMPLVQLDYAARAKVMRLKDDEKQELEKMGFDTAELVDIMNEFEKTAEGLYENILLYNEKNEEMSEFAASLNKTLLKLNKEVSMATDYLLTSLAGWFMIGHQIYGTKLTQLILALEMIKGGQAENALKEIIPSIDLACISIFNPGIAEEVKRQLEETSGVTWAKGKCISHLTLSEAVTGLTNKISSKQDNFDEEIKMLEQAIESEKANLRKIIEDETEGITRAIELMRECYKKIEHSLT